MSVDLILCHVCRKPVLMHLEACDATAWNAERRRQEVALAKLRAEYEALRAREVDADNARIRAELRDGIEDAS